MLKHRRIVGTAQPRNDLAPTLSNRTVWLSIITFCLLFWSSVIWAVFL